jgi:hypothetical protein
VRKFLREIDARKRRERIETVYNYRLAQAELKFFKEAMRKMEQQDRLVRLREARAEGQRLLDVELTEKESQVLDRQDQQFFSDWSDSEKEKFKAHQSQLWAMIPEKFRASAERYARGH